jgi:CRISPR-associated protein Cas6
MRSMQVEADVATATNQGERVDVAFPLAGESVPLDHGYALFGALCRVLGDLHGADWLAVHPVRGMPTSERDLALPPRNHALRLRVAPTEITRVLPLAGKSLEVLGSHLRVGVPSVSALQPSERLYSRCVVIKKFVDEAPFLDAVKRQLAEIEVSATPRLHRRRVLRIAKYIVVGFGVELSGLSDEDSLVVQRVGIGGRQRFGCGVFIPLAEAAL